MRLRKDEIALVDKTVNEPSRSIALAQESAAAGADLGRPVQGERTGERAQGEVDQDEPVPVPRLAQVGQDRDRDERGHRVGDKERPRDGDQELLRGELLAWERLGVRVRGRE